MFRGWPAHAFALTLAVAASSGTAVADDNPSALQKAAVFTKVSVVRVVGYWEVTFKLGENELKEYVGGTGSGFFASADGFVVTNAHVVEDIQNGEETAKSKAFDELLDDLNKHYHDEIAALTDDQKSELVKSLADSAVATPNAFVVTPDGAKFDYQIKAYGKPGTGSDVAIVKVEMKDAPNLAIADSDNVQVQDRILAIGYPGAADMEGLLDDKSQLEATMNEGAVSALKHVSTGEPIIQISASITHGNSGGPTVNEHGEVIGLSTFGSQGEVQGFNFLVASATVKKFLAQAKVDLAPSETIKSWRKGLDEYYDQYYDDAITDFELVLTKYPKHAEAERIERLARTAKGAGKGKTRPAPVTTGVGGGSGSGAGSGSSAKPSSSLSTVTPDSEGGNAAGIGIAVGLVLLGVTIGVVFLVKNRKKPGTQPAPGMHPGPSGNFPINHPQGPHAAVPNSTPMPFQMPPGGPPPGGVQPGRAPGMVAKTVAIGSHPPVAATAFGSLTLGTLMVTRGSLNGQRFSLTAQGILIGRQPGLAQIVVDDHRASGKHVWIGYEAGQLFAIDQGTTNGTFVNDVRFGRISKAPLKDGDVVIVSEPDCLAIQIKLT